MTQTALRKMGNSAGMIVPRSILGQIGVSIGAAMDLTVEDGKLIATPICKGHRAGWTEAAQDIALHEDTEAPAWRDFGNEGDGDLTW